jgi:hypothetical protein
MIGLLLIVAEEFTIVGLKNTSTVSITNILKLHIVSISEEISLFGD